MHHFSGDARTHFSKTHLTQKALCLPRPLTCHTELIKPHNNYLLVLLFHFPNGGASWAETESFILASTELNMVPTYKTTM